MTPAEIYEVLDLVRYRDWEFSRTSKGSTRARGRILGRICDGSETVSETEKPKSKPSRRRERKEQPRFTRNDYLEVYSLLSWGRQHDKRELPISGRRGPA